MPADDEVISESPLRNRKFLHSWYRVPDISTKCDIHLSPSKASSGQQGHLVPKPAGALGLLNVISFSMSLSWLPRLLWGSLHGDKSHSGAFTPIFASQRPSSTVTLKHCAAYTRDCGGSNVSVQVHQRNICTSWRS